VVLDFDARAQDFLKRITTLSADLAAHGWELLYREYFAPSDCYVRKPRVETVLVHMPECRFLLRPS
jgi:hypothetical protein